MSNQAFSRLAPFIQEYIYNHNWTEIRPVQVEACKVIFETEAHLLLAAGTASGKTEAAFLPILTLLHENPAQTVGVLYISPIKALINDQFERLTDLLKQADIPVWAWHGDVSQSRKNKLIKNPKGVLQITPESLESLLINKHNELAYLFGDLRFIVIDEIHAFMGSERGSQILCQLARLSRYTNKQARRIGLSATLGDYSLAQEWLSSGTKISVITPEIKGGQRNVQLSLAHFYIPEEPPSISYQEEGNGNKLISSAYYQYLFNSSKARKCLIFANNRAQIESVIANLRQIAETKGLPDIYHVHHGSISASLREDAESAMRGNNPAVTAATVTLELGIDIGQLERVIQLEAPLSVASFLQRLGRSGRRGAAADMQFVCAEDELSGEESLPEQIPWQLLQAIAIIQLYLEERWIEPIKPLRYPLSLLYHQTMSILTAKGELSPAALAQEVLTLPSFKEISEEDFRQLLYYLIEIEHIQQGESGGLIIGLMGEQIVRKFNFYTVFTNTIEYIVRDDSTEIGSIIMPPPAGNRFALAGRTWKVLEVDPRRKTVFVERVQGIANVSWRGGHGNIHTKILQRMKRVLVEDVEYPYLQNNARERLKITRKLAQDTGLDRNHIIQAKDNTYCIFPWAGTIAYRTLERVINSALREFLDIKSIGGLSPYFISLKLGKSHPEEFYEKITEFCVKDLTPDELVAPNEAPRLQKYDEFIPNNLLRKAFINDYLDVLELRQILRSW